MGRGDSVAVTDPEHWDGEVPSPCGLVRCCPTDAKHIGCGNHVDDDGQVSHILSCPVATRAPVRHVGSSISRSCISRAA